MIIIKKNPEAEKKAGAKYVIKRNGSEDLFDEDKIVNALFKANDSTIKNKITKKQIGEIADHIKRKVDETPHALNIEDIQDMVENELMQIRAFDVARSYITYRYKRALARQHNTTDDKILSLIEHNNEEVKQENSNKNPIVNSVQRDYMAGEVSKDLCKRVFLPGDIWEAHEDGLIHFHDADYFAQHMHNCCLVNLEDMLQNGTVISGTMIDKPKSFATACNIATQAIAQIASQQYGGQTMSIAHLAPFVEISRQKYMKKQRESMEKAGVKATETQLASIVEDMVDEEIKRGVQMIQYQLITLMTTNGQAPFVTIYMYLNECRDEKTKADMVKIIREMFLQRIQGVKNEQGVWVTPAFPKLIYVLEEDNIREGSRYWELTQLAAKCTAKRMVPDYISEKIMKQLKNGDVYSCMGCRSFLTVDRTNGNIANATNYKEGEHKYYGRFNQGVVTLNLVDVACTSAGDEDYFWEILDKRLELCHKALRIRHERLLGTPSDVAPILW